MQQFELLDAQALHRLQFAPAAAYAGPFTGQVATSVRQPVPVAKQAVTNPAAQTAPGTPPAWASQLGSAPSQGIVGGQPPATPSQPGSVTPQSLPVGQPPAGPPITAAGNGVADLRSPVVPSQPATSVRQLTPDTTPTPRRGLSWQMLVVLIVATICGIVLAVALGMDLRQAQDQVQAAARRPSDQAVLSDKSAARVTQTGAAGSTLSISGRAYVDATMHTSAPGRPLVVAVWPAPFVESGTPTCALLHGSEVRLLESATDSTGKQAFKVQAQACAGWIEERWLSPTTPK